MIWQKKKKDNGRALVACAREATMSAAGRDAPTGRAVAALLSTTGERGVTKSQGELRRIAPPTQDRF